MTDSEYCIDRKPAITMLTTVLTTVCYGMLRYATAEYPPDPKPSPWAHWPLPK